MKVVAAALTPDAYAPYGDVIMASPHGEPGKPANMGTARRFDRVAALRSLRGAEAPLNVAVFRCAAAIRFPYAVPLLERHAASSQAFVPMEARPYVVIVARGGDAPDLSTLAAFVAGAGQGITYHPGVWHHPMIALEATTDFLCLVHEDGGPADCDVVTIADGERPLVILPT